MSDLFFYGTLRYPPLLEIVLGRRDRHLDMQAAELPDHAIVAAGGQPYPMIVPRAGAVAPGVLVRGLGDTEIARLNHYEGGFDYDLHPVLLRAADGSRAAARAFFPPSGADAPGPGAAWSLEDWAARWGALTLRAAEEIMAWHGRIGAADIAARFPSIRRRAYSWTEARRRAADPRHDLSRDVEVVARLHAYLNFFAVEEMDLRYRRHDGTMSDVVNRGAIFVGNVAAVLPYDPRRDAVLLIEQFRAPVYMSGDPAPWMAELPAGVIDLGETPEQAAHREVMEEAGIALSRLEPVGQVYSSTGSSTEFVSLFVGIADLGAVGAGHGGIAAEGEDILRRIVGFDDLMRAVDRRDFRLMPLVTAALWLARHRDRLRDGA